MLCQIRVHGGGSYINLQVPDVFRWVAVLPVSMGVFHQLVHVTSCLH